LLFVAWFCFASVAFAVNPADLLAPEQAFRLNVAEKKANLAVFSWDVASGYYLYRQKLKIVSLTPGITVEKLIFPPGLTKHDEFFGDVEIYRGRVEVDVVLRKQNPAAQSATFEVTSRGCTDSGICYPPLQNIVAVNLPSGPADASAAQPVSAEKLKAYISEQDRIADSLKSQSVWLTALGFLGFGLLLAFTPCVFPMTPILSGIVAGQSQQLTTRRAFGLSLSYVLASAITYTVFGVLAGLFGNNLQVFFQKPWVISVFSGIFIVLALSMFGFFQFQMPAFIQAKIVTFSSRQKGGSMVGAAVMGVLSTLIVGPCVTAPLTGTLI
jgi:thiol:disulfide interchange protein DsbD